MNAKTMNDYSNTPGCIHSFQSLGAVDGPGVRFVVFLQGCPLRCVYCHNPDTWAFPDSGGQKAEITKPGKQSSVDAKSFKNAQASRNAQAFGNAQAGERAALKHIDPAMPLPEPEDCFILTAGETVKKILRFRPYIRNGGVTVSGGEALSQPEFTEALFALLREEGLHTALDTSCFGDLEKAKRVLSFTDLVIADLKFGTQEEYRRYCGADMGQILEFLHLTERMQIPLWIRHVVVPDLNDEEEKIRRVAAVSRGFQNLERFELLPFRNLCVSKYEAMGICFPLQEYEECSQEEIDRLGKTAEAVLRD